MLFGMVVTVFRIEADYEVYILMRLPLISQCFINKWLVHRRVNSGWCTKRVNTYLVYQTRKHAVGATGAVIRQLLIRVKTDSLDFILGAYIMQKYKNKV